MGSNIKQRGGEKAGPRRLAEKAGPRRLAEKAGPRRLAEGLTLLVCAKDYIRLS